MPLVIKCISSIVIVALLLVSCERVITVNINPAPAKFVVEGFINDDSLCWVRFSKTDPINDTINVIGVSNAKITISDSYNNSVQLTEANGRGIYRGRFLGRPGNTYHLKVEYKPLDSDLKTFYATSTMPQKVLLDSLYVSERLFLGQKRLFATVQFKDPPAAGNAYRFIQYVDGVQDVMVFVWRDDLINGRIVTNQLLIFNNNYTLKKCDQLRVVLQSIDQPNYLFWYSLNQSALGASQSASPGNPASNISGGAIGYFSAHTVSERNIAVFPDSSCSFPADKN